MENYFELLKYLKACNQNLQVLHRHIIGENFFSTHPVLGDYYEYVGDMIDDLVEIGLAIGVKDPTINESIEDYETLDTISRDCHTSFLLVQEYFNSIIDIIEWAKTEVPPDVKNKLEEYEYYFRKESKYKIKHFLGDKV